MAKASRDAGSHAARCRVLLVDDTPEIRLLLKLMLETDGRFQVVGEAADGAAAIDLTDASEPDAIVLDLAMPVMDGLEAIPVLKERDPEVKILVLSGFDAHQMSEEALQRGADAYIEKGGNLMDLAASLATLCADNGNVA